MDIRNAYSTWASTYDTDLNLTRDLDQIVTREMLGTHHYRTILEVGCGTGKNTELLAGLADRVYALDFSEGMIAQARAKLHADHVYFAIADLTKPWPCPSQRAELAVCNLVLEHIADLAFIFAEAFRVLVDHGSFYVCELHPFKQYQGKKAVFQRDQQQTEIPAFVHHLSSFVQAAEHAGFTMKSLREWWHDTDPETSPRLVSFLFEK